MEEVHCEILLRSFSFICFDKHEQSLSVGRKGTKILRQTERKYQHNFNIEANASGYAMGAILMQHKRPIIYHSENFSKKIEIYNL